MSDASNRLVIVKRLLIVAVALVASTMASVIGARIAVESLFKGIASSRATGLSAVAWGPSSMWSSGGNWTPEPFPANRQGWISRNAEVAAHSSSFFKSVQELRHTVAAHHGYLDKLFTQSRSGVGRILAATLAVPSSDFDATLADVKKLGRVDAVSESGEDSAIKVAGAARLLAAAQSTLSRLQKLQQERKGELRGAVALEKEITLANEALSEAERKRDELVSKVDLSYIQLTLGEEYRAPLETHFSEATLHLRNALVEGFGAIFYSLSLFLGVLFEFGLPLLFWLVLLFWPLRAGWQRFRHTPRTISAAQ
jgi:hypothetical protein